MPLEQREKDKILSVFCKNTCAEISGPAKTEFLRIMRVPGWEELTKNAAFNAYYSLLEELLKLIEELQAIEPGGLRLKKTLELLSEKKTGGEADEINAFKKLVEEKLLPFWGDGLIDLYHKGVAILEEWDNFFISYTNQSAPGVNRTYKKIISEEVSREELREYGQTVNLIGKVLHAHLKVQRATSFYDKVALHWSDEWRSKIFQYTKSSFAFIQVIETEIFGQDPPNNVCFSEYESYKESIENFCTDHGLPDIKPKFYFLICNPEKKKDFRFEPAEDIPKLQSWVDHIRETQFETLYKELTKSQLRQKIQEAVLESKAYRKELFRNYVNAIH